MIVESRSCYIPHLDSYVARVVGDAIVVFERHPVPASAYPTKWGNHAQPAWTGKRGPSMLRTWRRGRPSRRATARGDCRATDDPLSPRRPASRGRASRLRDHERFVTALRLPGGWQEPIGTVARLAIGDTGEGFGFRTARIDLSGPAHVVG